MAWSCLREFFSHAAADVLGTHTTSFKWMKMFQDSTKKGIYAPFADHDEWELARWLIKTINQCATNEFLKLPINCLHPTFSSSHTFLKLIDQLSTGLEWTCQMIQMHNNLDPIESNTPDGLLANNTDSEELELWMRDPVTCVRELIDNPAFDDSMAYTPEKVYEHLPSGATIAPVIIASDKTHLSHFKGYKTAWPVYLSISNLSKQVWHEPSWHSAVLLGYLPMICVDAWIRRVFPILAAYIGNHPEQCLIACCIKNHCSKNLHSTTKHKLNKHFTCKPLASLQPVFPSFWADFPHTDIFICISSNILHQLHQGLFKDYLKKWCAAIAGLDDFDAWFRAMPIFPGLQHFNNSISQIRQWTSTDHKQLQQVFIGGLIGITTEPHILQAAYGLTNFICLVQYQSHTDKTIQALLQALDNFHGAKDVFIKLGFFHFLLHYIDMIKNLRSLDRVNTESSECLHINYTKKAYTASSWKDYSEMQNCCNT
ncbi:hypothetical protein HD554DRAFT_2203745 [Boletus coccyginus]|nr:hypothetical protein HD554DRAFT_2203745 [Boletus coccyginus]